MSTRVLFVLTSHDKLGTTGQPTGAYLPEISHPFAVFAAAGVEVDFVSTQGGPVPLYGGEKPDAVTASFVADEKTFSRLADSLAPGEVDASKYAAVFYAGGHGTMWDFPSNETLARIAASVYERGGVVGAVCHGPAGLLPIRLSTGEYLVRGKAVAAFTNDEEKAAGLERVVPFLLADALVERGARHEGRGNWQPHVVVSDRLVTGQNPASAKGVAESILRVLRETSR